jgi:hypothetical protein
MRPGCPVRDEVKAREESLHTDTFRAFFLLNLDEPLSSINNFSKDLSAMAKIGKRTASNWMIGTHPVNTYKIRVPDPAVKRGRRSSRDIRRMIAQALNRVRDDGRTVYLCACTYKGRPKPKTLYRIQLFKNEYYVLCLQLRILSLFTSDMIVSDACKGNLVFRDEQPFDELMADYG